MSRMTKRTLTPDQVVAYNLKIARELHDWTQDEAAEHLEPYLGERWSRVVFSAAERSVTSGRVRHFHASQLVAFAAAFDLPISFFLQPPPDIESFAAPGAKIALTRAQLVDLATASAQERARPLAEKHLREYERLMGLTREELVDMARGMTRAEFARELANKKLANEEEER